MITDTRKAPPQVLGIRELSPEEVDEISGAGIISFVVRVAKAVVRAIKNGPGDVRRPLDRPK